MTTTTQQAILFLIESLSDHEFFLCENETQAKTLSYGFVQEAKMLQSLIEKLERELLIEQRRYSELLEHKDLLAKEVQCARMYVESLKESKQ